MKRLLGYIIVALISLGLGWSLNYLLNSKSNIGTSVQEILPHPLEKYTLENLSKTEIKPGKFQKENDLFSFEFYPEPGSRQLKKITGQIMVPEKPGKYPLVLMLRGYVDQEIYKTGVGTNRAATVFAQNGFVTLAPDFLGYAGSDQETGNVMEARFQTYTTVLSLLASLNQIESWDGKNVFLWGHSNGGQIALTVLEITGKAIPTTLWAPVSKPFPYSVLYYTDEAEDRGKFLRSEIAKFEELYNADSYSISEYFAKINAPLQIHQGSGDEAVPIAWSNQLIDNLKELEKEVIYLTYPGADHNLVPNWNQVVARDIAFFQKHLTAN